MRRVQRMLAVVTMAVAMAGGAWFVRGHYRVYVVRTGSMSPTFRPGDAVIDRPPTGHYRVGEVVTFAARTGRDALITHRIHDLNGGTIHTKGDANRTPDLWNVSGAAVRGQVAHGLRYGGYILVYLHQPAGVASLLTVTLALSLAWGLYFPTGPDPDAPPAAA